MFLRDIQTDFVLLTKLSSFVIVLAGKYVLFGSNKEEMKRNFLESFTEEDWIANEKMNEELAQIREDIAPTWLQVLLIFI
jgi:hypothetical protein